MELLSFMDVIADKLGLVNTMLFFYLFMEIRDLKRRLLEGDTKFESLDAEMKASNKSLNIIAGKLDVIVSMKTRSHTPEEKPL